MRILHTSDWHIGRSFHGTQMIDTQREAIDQIVGLVTEHQVDLVLIAGDVYDRALPPVDAVNLLDEALVAIRRAGADIVITTGNHDSATRLGFGRALMEASGVYVRSTVEDITAPMLFPATEDSTPALAVWGIPYIEPRSVAQAWGIDSNHTAVMTECIRRITEARAELEAAGTLDPERTVHLVMAHLFVAGGSGSESERDIGEGDTVGGLGQVSTAVFDGFDYVALGHLHGRQKLTDTVRYSGSPVAYSFSEANHTKGAWLLDLDASAGEITEIVPVDITAGRPLAVLSGELEDLVSNPTYQWAEDAWCQITVTDEIRPERAYQRVKERFDGLLNFVLTASSRTGDTARGVSYAEKITQAKTDLEVCTEFVSHVRGREASEAETDHLREALEQAREEASEAMTR